MKERTLTRRDFLKVAGAGAAGATMLGAAGCGSLANSFTQVPDEYLPSGGSRMNVILVIIDSLRRDHLGVYGNDWIKTPNLDALAKESLRFDRSSPESLPTILARRAIHTGIRTFPFRDWQKWYDEDVSLWGWQPIPRGQVTLAEILLGGLALIGLAIRIEDGSPVIYRQRRAGRGRRKRRDARITVRGREPVHGAAVLEDVRAQARRRTP